MSSPSICAPQRPIISDFPMNHVKCDKKRLARVKEFQSQYNMRETPESCYMHAHRAKVCKREQQLTERRIIEQQMARWVLPSKRGWHSCKQLGESSREGSNEHKASVSLYRSQSAGYIPTTEHFLF